MRVVVDTNVLISGTLVEGGFAGRIVDSIVAGTHILIGTPRLFEEYHQVIRRRHIATRYPKAVRRSVGIERLLLRSEVSIENPDVRPVSLDPNDDYLLACAIEGHADAIVSADQHLLQLGSYQGILIVTPREFVERFDS